MASQPHNNVSKHHKHKRTSSSRKHHFVPSWLRHYWLELSALLFFVVGVFLLLEQLEIKATIWKIMVGVYEALRSSGRSIRDTAVYVFSTFEKSDLVGATLILVAALILLHTIRSRAISRHPELGICPDCGGHIRRIKRAASKRLLLKLLAIRITYYACSKCSFRHSFWRNSWQK